MSNSCSSSLSSDEDDEFACFRTSKVQDEESSARRNSRAASIGKTPTMKTPSMDALTRKYEFLLGQDDNLNLTNNNSNDGADTDYLQTTVLSPEKGDRTRSRGSRNSSRSATPTRRPVLSAQKILHRLQSGETEDSDPTGSRIPQASPSWEVAQVQQTGYHESRYRSQLKQNLEQKLQQLENESPITKTPPRPDHNQRQHPRPTATRPSSYHRTSINYSKEKRNPSLSLLPNAPTSPSDFRFPVASSTTTTTTTMALTEAPSPPLKAKTNHQTFPSDNNHSDQQAEKLGIVPLVESSPLCEDNTGDDGVHLSPQLEYKESNNMSYWHRWKMAETRLRQQQEEFDQEKEEWMRQLESAHSVNTKVQALVKRYDVQLRAVHKTCLQQDGAGFESDGDDDGEFIKAPDEEPPDPLHLLLLKENGTDVDTFEWKESEDADVDDKESTSSTLKRRMERTKTKNVILAHLVRLLERRAEQEKRDLEQQLKEEKEAKDELWTEFNQAQLYGRGDVLAPYKSTENKVRQIPPTGNDQVKALEHRLWLREQQYAQERKEFEIKVQTLQAECDRYKKNGQGAKSPTQASNVHIANLTTGRLEDLQRENAALQSRCDALQKECDHYEQQAIDAERYQKFKELQQTQERSQLERQLAKAQDDLRGLSQAQEKVRTMEEKLERMEAKHARERKEWEAKLLQQGKRLVANSANNNSLVSKELQEKQRKRWEAQLEAVQKESEHHKEEADKCRERESHLVKENKNLARNLTELKEQLELSQKEREEQNAGHLEEHNFKILELQQKFAEDQQEYKNQLDMLRDQRDERCKEIEHLQSQLDENETEITKLRHQLIETEAPKEVVTELEKKIDRLECELQEERESAQNAWQEVSCLKEQIMHLKEQHASDAQLSQGILSEKYEDLEYELQKCKHDLDRCMKTVELEGKKCIQLTEENIQLEREIERLGQRHSEQKGEWDIIVDSLNAEKNASFLGSEKYQELLIRENQLEKQLMQTKDDLDKTVKCLKIEKSRTRAAEEENYFLDRQLKQLNERFVQEMKELEASYNSHSNNGRTLELATKVDNLYRELDEERRKGQKTFNEKESLQIELRKLVDESKRTVNDSESLQMEGSSSHQDLSDRNLELQKQLEEARKELRATIESLNAEVGNSSDHDRELQKLNVAFAHEKHELEEQLSWLQADRRRTQEELNEKNDRLEAEVRELQTSLDAATEHLGIESDKHRHAKERIMELEFELDEADKAFAEEKIALEYEIQRMFEEKTTLEYDIQRQSGEMYELAEAKVRLEQQLEETKRELDSCRKSWQLDSERCHELFDKASSLETEINQMRLEKKNNEGINTQLEREIETIKSIYEKAIQDWRNASEQSNEEISKMQQQQDKLVQEKHSLQIQLSAAERQIEVIQTDLHPKKREWQNQTTLLSQNTVDKCTDAVEELKREVVKVREHMVLSSETVKEVANRYTSNRELLSKLEKIQVEINQAARKLSSEAQAVGEILKAGKDLHEQDENVTIFFPDEKDMLLEQQRSILELIKEIRLEKVKSPRNKVDTVAVDKPLLQEISEKPQQYKSDVERLKDLLDKATNDLVVEKEKRVTAERKAAMLSVCDNEVMRPQSPSVQREEVPLDAAAQGNEAKKIESLPNNDDHAMSFDVYLDRQLDDLNNQIDQEIEEVRSLCHQKATYVVPYEESTEAREAMVAQSFLLVQSIRDLMSDDTEDQEEGSDNVMQHLEVLSELMAEVDREDHELSSATGNNKGKLVEVRMGHETAEGILVPPKSHSDREEADLLRYELAQDDSMLDLLNEEPPDHGIQPTSGESDDSAVGTGTTCENYYDAAEVIPSRNERTEAASPIQLMIEQTYNRCQVLERERCDLMNVTLDLLSAAREANKAELDAALATARRKASEEMLQMKTTTQAQVDRIWFNLCEKCQKNLENGSI